MSDIELGPKCLATLEADIAETYNSINTVVLLLGLLSGVGLSLLLPLFATGYLPALPTIVSMGALLVLWVGAILWRRVARLKVDLVLFSCPLPLSTQMKVWLKSRG